MRIADTSVTRMTIEFHMDLLDARDEIRAIRAHNSVLREMLHAALDQLHQAHVREERRRSSLSTRHSSTAPPASLSTPESDTLPIEITSEAA